jgi:Ti-type conjugative transfer relaxase TraA
MAIQFARARYISRSTGGDAVRSAAYNARAALAAERTGQVFYFKNRDAPTLHEILLPTGAAERFRDCGVLWNAVEAAEKRRDSQVAREVLLALPSDPGVTDEDRIELARSFAETHFVSKGLAVQLDVHAPHEPAAEGEEAGGAVNHHAHLLITTRRLEGEVFAAYKARDLDPQMRSGIPHLYNGVVKHGFVADAEAWGELWRAHQERYFIEHGLTISVDPIAAHPGTHIGPVRMRQVGSELVERAELLRQANEEAARDPAQVLDILTRNNATFSENDIDRYLSKHIDEDEERALVKSAVQAHADVLALYDRDSLVPVERWTTLPVRQQELSALADAEVLARKSPNQGVAAEFAHAALEARRLRTDQRLAFDHAIAAGGLKIIEGRAGTGKSFTLQAVREAHERAGLRVIGLAPTNAVAQDLKGDGFTEAGTVHSELFKLKNGRTSWNASSVVIVDEAAMLDSKILGGLLAAARAAHAKLIFAGDDKQLASIERGGLFTELKQRHGAAAIVEVTRQRADWQRQASRDLAEGRFSEAITAFDQHGAITWRPTQESARAALVEAWRQDALKHPDAARFVFAYTNADVDALNADLRAVSRARGELKGPDISFETKHGVLAFAVGDRVQFTDTRKAAGLYNGHAGVITAIDAETGNIAARLDSAAGQAGREVSWSAAEFDGFRHGYAGTIYKGQGRTLDRTYLYHTHHWRSAASYVALTRQRESAQIFVATETARHGRDLTWQMARGEIKSASVAFATADEVAAARREVRLQEMRERLARDPDVARRNFENHQIERALRSILPDLAPAIERQVKAVAVLAEAAERLGEKLRAHVLKAASAVRKGLSNVDKPQPAQKHSPASQDLPAAQASIVSVPEIAALSEDRLSQGQARKSKFAGLKLSGRLASERVPRAPPPEARTAEMPGDRMARELTAFARAWADAARMTQAGLPVLPHQEAARALALEKLERVKIGLARDATIVVTRDPSLAAAAAGGQEAEIRALYRLVEAEQRSREALDARSRTAVEAWTSLERDYEAAGKAHQWDVQRAVGTRLIAFARELKQDVPLDSLLRERGRELGIIEGSRLDLVVQAREIDRSLTYSIDIEHGPRPHFGPSLGM